MSGHDLPELKAYPPKAKELAVLFMAEPTPPVYLSPTTEDIMAAVLRVEGKLDTLIAALADEPEDTSPLPTLDGTLAGGERDQGQSLG